ncbi:MAG TPA: hypothetical protein VG322_08570 [Candidatus Acidoferrales bacterium]|jgi:hypothetical protein|nr:hypothetical protein [Candidatus Acidoferrales bacterium]
MELDRALELAVISAWDELIGSGGPCSVHVEYKNVARLPLSLMEVWTIAKRGYGTLAFRYATPRSDTSRPQLENATMNFANSYHSETLASNFDFIMKNQGDFSRPGDQSIHGSVQIETPNEEDRKIAATWRSTIGAGARAGLGV